MLTKSIVAEKIIIPEHSEDEVAEGGEQGAC
jgi:hypothetical protein